MALPPLATKILFGLTIFMAAYLMFQIEPLAGKIVTARFGGSASIWSVCLLFFQLVVLAGYLVTYTLCKASPRAQAVVFAGCAASSLLLVRLPKPELWVAQNQPDPVQALLGLLILYLALPCVFLSSISGMLQYWFALMKLGNPYPLYSLSNAGSLGALLLYPTFIEPRIGVANTLSLWGWGFMALALLALLCAFTAVKLPNCRPSADAHTAVLTASGAEDFLWWLSLSALGSTVLLVLTTYLTQDLAPVPLLWVVPLSIYLLTFILCFAGNQFYRRKIFLFFGPVLWIEEQFLSTPTYDAIFLLLIIFFYCMSCHGELVLKKPAPRQLPLFYLAIAIGGALGGILVNLVAPVVFDSYVERGLLVLFMVALLFNAVCREGLSLFNNRWLDAVALIALGCSVMVLALPRLLLPRPGVLWQQRNFYGCISVADSKDAIVLYNGRIIHGVQYKDPRVKSLPTQYYARPSAAGLIDHCYRLRHPQRKLHYGIIGLGAGTMAAYAVPGDSVTFYEIDPKVQHAARRYFSFLADCRGKVETVSGDARLTMAAEKPRNYDILLVDAFNGDAIPVHLLTREAFELYLKHLRSDGILLVHISNKYLDLEPVVANIANSLGLVADTIASTNGRYVAVTLPGSFQTPLVPKDPKHFPGIKMHRSSQRPSLGIWTDDYSNLIGILKPGT